MLKTHSFEVFDIFRYLMALLHIKKSSTTNSLNVRTRVSNTQVGTGNIRNEKLI